MSARIGQHQHGTEAARSWRLPGGIAVEMPAAVMGVVNATPDSFSDGGRHGDAQAAIAHGLRLVDQGAAWIDVGGESTRPGSRPVAPDLEIARVAPVVAALAARCPARVAISVDTMKAAVARAALDAGARVVNDVSAGADPAMLPLVAERGCAVVLMHMQGAPATMQRAPRYVDVVDEVLAALDQRIESALAAGVDEGALLIDPGIGFGKTPAHNLALLRALPRFSREFGRPLVVGVSRKSFLPVVAGVDLAAGERDGLSHIVHALIARECALVRAHDVAGARAALALASALTGTPADRGGDV
ncbi:MAG TPA: dihydropteroate synthase [Planctomycetota bacterium]|nr:dihydropteroate synthase [Planctomycetota bacterium]